MDNSSKVLKFLETFPGLFQRPDIFQSKRWLLYRIYLKINISRLY